MLRRRDMPPHRRQEPKCLAAPRLNQPRRTVLWNIRSVGVAKTRSLSQSAPKGCTLERHAQDAQQQVRFVSISPEGLHFGTRQLNIRAGKALLSQSAPKGCTLERIKKGGARPGCSLSQSAPKGCTLERCHGGSADDIDAVSISPEGLHFGTARSRAALDLPCCVSISPEGLHFGTRWHGRTDGF